MNIYGIIYQAKLVGVNDENVLKDISYFGQSGPLNKKLNTPEKIFEKRKSQHIQLSNNKPKELGFMYVLRTFGVDSFEWKIVESKYGTIEEVQKWLDDRERYYIKINGGVLRDMDKKINQTFNLQSGGKNIAYKKLFESIQAKSNKNWNKFILHLNKYNEENGNINVQQKYICDDGYKLGNTIVSVRGGNMLSSFNNQERKEYLDNFPGWIWNIINNKFEKFYSELVKYKEIYGDINVAQEYKTDDDYFLGRQLNHVRQGQYIKDNYEYKDKLEKLGIIWCPRDEKINIAWDKIKNDLQNFYNDNGHSNVPSYTELGKYVGHIRQREDFVKENLERQEFLKSINFIWNIKTVEEEESWIKFWHHINKFLIEYNHCNVPARYKCTDGYTLGSHCASIRHRNQYINDLDKKRKLENIGFSFNPLDDKWFEFLKELKKYKDIYGNCKVPENYITNTNYKLGQSVRSVRQGAYINKPEHKKELEEMGFIWVVHDKAWDDFLEHLIEYMKNNNDSLELLTRKTILPDDYKLGARINNIKSREQFIKNNPERKAILNILGLYV